MSRSPNPWHDIQLQAREQEFSARQHSYDLTQRLAYYVISAELVICGYMLLNADKLPGLSGAGLLFCICGIAAFCGIAWRFFYNQGYHNSAHGIRASYAVPLYVIQLGFYWIFIGLTFIVFLWVIVAGYGYIDRLNHVVQSTAASTQQTDESTRLAPATTAAKPVHAAITTAPAAGGAVKPKN